MAVAAVAFVAATFRASPARLNWRPIGDGALAAARACDGPLYNHYDDGGTLIWFLPEKPVFVDGRQDPYPLPFLLEVVAVEAGRSRTARCSIASASAARSSPSSRRPSPRWTRKDGRRVFATTSGRCSRRRARGGRADARCTIAA